MANGGMAAMAARLEDSVKKMRGGVKPGSGGVKRSVTKHSVINRIDLTKFQSVGICVRREEFWGWRKEWGVGRRASMSVISVAFAVEEGISGERSRSDSWPRFSRTANGVVFGSL